MDWFLYRYLLISVPKSYEFDILKTYGQELKIAVHFMEIDGVDKGDKLFGTNYCLEVKINKMFDNSLKECIKTSHPYIIDNMLIFCYTNQSRAEENSGVCQCFYNNKSAYCPSIWNLQNKNLNKQKKKRR